MLILKALCSNQSFKLLRLFRRAARAHARALARVSTRFCVRLPRM